MLEYFGFCNEHWKNQHMNTSIFSGSNQNVLKRYGSDQRVLEYFGFCNEIVKRQQTNTSIFSKSNQNVLLRVLFLQSKNESATKRTRSFSAGWLINARWNTCVSSKKKLEALKQNAFISAGLINTCCNLCFLTCDLKAPQYERVHF